jgi:hypothetical protein
MPVAEQRSAFQFEVGEEVVIRLDDALAYEVGNSSVVVTALPPWTIGEILEREIRDGVGSYVVAFPLRDSKYQVRVTEAAIEGTA